MPILNLIRPFQIVTEIWKGSGPTVTDDASLETRPSSPLIGWWWVLFLSNLLVYLVARLAFSGDKTVSDLISQSWFSLVGDAVEIPAAMLAVLLVSKINTAQEQRYSGLQSALGLPPR